MDWYRRALELWLNGQSYNQIAKELALTYDNVRSYIRRTDEYKKKQADIQGTSKASMTLNADGTRGYERIIKLKDAENATPEDILKAHGLDPKLWILISCKNNWWESQRKGGATMPLYQSKITVKPVTGEAKLLDKYIEFFKQYEPKRKIAKAKHIERQPGQLLAVEPVDVHLGKLGWEPESGANYDYKIASSLFEYVIDCTVTTAKQNNVTEIIYPIGQDFLHFDNQDSTTTKGTPQDADIRPQKMFKVGLTLQAEALEKLAEDVPVYAYYVMSNHDEMSSYHLAVALWGMFKNHPRVHIDISPYPRKYHEFGKVLIGMSHGDWDKNRLHGLMPIEAPEAWGRTKYREMLVGHIHKEKVTKKKLEVINDEEGVVVRHLGSITGPDAWHTKSGYVGAVRKSQNLLYDYKNGLTDIFYINV